MTRHRQPARSLEPPIKDKVAELIAPDRRPLVGGPPTSFGPTGARWLNPPPMGGSPARPGTGVPGGTLIRGSPPRIAHVTVGALPRFATARVSRGPIEVVVFDEG